MTLLRFWPYLLGCALLIAAGVYLRQAGYESGYASSEAHWRPLFLQAERDRDAAIEKNRKLENASRQITVESERQLHEAIASVSSRADAAELRYRSLLRQQSARPSCGAGAQVSGTPAVPDDRAPFIVRTDQIARDIALVGRDCESDAATLKALQSWVRDQQKLAESERTSE
jgi:hypothetical protein